MSSEISLSAYAVWSACLLVFSFFLPVPRIPWPRVKLRAHAEKHGRFRVVDLGFAFFWPKFTRKTVGTTPSALEFAIYFTMKA
jgi:hypothetical protein